VNISESDTVVTLAVERQTDSYGTASVNFTTFAGSAQNNVHFIPQSGTLWWQAGDQTPKIISITLLDDMLYGPPRQFAVELLSAEGATLTSAQSERQALIWIDNSNPSHVEWSSASSAGTLLFFFPDFIVFFSRLQISPPQSSTL